MAEMNHHPHEDITAPFRPLIESNNCTNPGDPTMSTTIDPNHPLIELLGGIGPARTLLRALTETTRAQVDIVRLVSQLRAQLEALEKVEQALRPREEGLE